MTLGGSTIQYISRKKNINTQSSNEAELDGADDTYTIIIWTQLLFEAQEYETDKKIFNQDNKSTILL